MRHTNVKLVSREKASAVQERRASLGRCMVELGLISEAELHAALDLQRRQQVPLSDILIAQGLVQPDDALTALSAQYGLYKATLRTDPPDHRLFGDIPAEFWIRHRIAPWIQLGQTLLLATSRPDLIESVKKEWPGRCPELSIVLAGDGDILAAIQNRFGPQLAQQASQRVPAQESCRTWKTGWLQTRLGQVATLAGSVLVVGAFPKSCFNLLCSIAILSLFFVSIQKLAGYLAHVRNTRGDGRRQGHCANSTALPYILPKVSMLVPLFREQEVATALVDRLSRLTYPKALLDVKLVVESRDHVTQDALVGANLPSWMSVVDVPEADGLTTKPRAMNYALDFCDGDIIGIWDAEDAPQPDQVECAVANFAHAPSDVVCLQGMLDFYNPRSNWMARCFTIEYASWWRVILPGMVRLGHVIPLGGTTLFFRRDALIELGGWDAHNVTEDADLGVRLARHGYRTQLIPTVTMEEANCRTWPWIKQRSRWLKGFMVTYLVHMRDPRQLMRDLGKWRFWGFQAFFVGTISQFLLAPVLWSFWILCAGFSHPFADVLPSGGLVWVLWLFVLSACVNLTISLAAVWTPQHQFLMRSVPLQFLYFPLGALASYKALYELMFKPFYWDKTQHGHCEERVRHCPDENATFATGHPASGGS